MSSNWGKTTPSEKCKRVTRSLHKAIRELDRERSNMERKEKKVTQLVREIAKQGKQCELKQEAKDLLQLRRFVQRFSHIKADIQVVLQKVDNVKPCDDIEEIIKSVISINKQVKLPDIQDIITEFEKKYDNTEMECEMIYEVVEDTVEDQDDEDDETISQWFEDAPKLPTATQHDGIVNDADLEARLSQLKQ